MAVCCEKIGKATKVTRSSYGMDCEAGVKLRHCPQNMAILEYGIFWKLFFFSFKDGVPRS